MEPTIDPDDLDTAIAFALSNYGVQCNRETLATAIGYHWTLQPNEQPRSRTTILSVCQRKKNDARHWLLNQASGLGLGGKNLEALAVVCGCETGAVPQEKMAVVCSYIALAMRRHLTSLVRTKFSLDEAAKLILNSHDLPALIYSEYFRADASTRLFCSDQLKTFATRLLFDATAKLRAIAPGNPVVTSNLQYLDIRRVAFEEPPIGIQEQEEEFFCGEDVRAGLRAELADYLRCDYKKSWHRDELFATPRFLWIAFDSIVVTNMLHSLRGEQTRQDFEHFYGDAVSVQKIAEMRDAAESTVSMSLLASFAKVYRIILTSYGLSVDDAKVRDIMQLKGASLVSFARSQLSGELPPPGLAGIAFGTKTLRRLIASSQDSLVCLHAMRYHAGGRSTKQCLRADQQRIAALLAQGGINNEVGRLTALAYLTYTPQNQQDSGLRDFAMGQLDEAEPDVKDLKKSLKDQWRMMWERLK